MGSASVMTRQRDFYEARKVLAAIIVYLGDSYVSILYSVLSAARIARLDRHGGEPFHYRTISSALEVIRIAENIDISLLSSIGPLVSSYLFPSACFVSQLGFSISYLTVLDRLLARLLCKD